MKKIITLVCLLFLAGTAWAVSLIGSGVGGDECADALICQNFEGAGYDNGETWTEYKQENSSNVTIDPDYTSTVLRGSQSLLLGTTSYQAGTITSEQTSSAIVSVHFIYRFDAIPTDSIAIFELLDSTDTMISRIALIYSNSSIKGYHGSSGTSYYSIAINTTYHIWFDYTKGNGSDGVLNMYISSNNIKPSSATMSLTNGTSTTDGRKIKFRVRKTMNSFFDQIIVKDTIIGDVPE